MPDERNALILVVHWVFALEEHTSSLPGLVFIFNY